MRFVCVVDGVPEESTSLLRAACAARGIEYLEVDAPSFDYAPSRRLVPGDLLFRPAGSEASLHVERFLHADGVASFYEDARRLYLDTDSPRLVLERAGVPVPATVYCVSADRAVLATLVDRLGGLPIVANLGSEGGRGTLLLETWAAVYSTLDFCVAQGVVTELSTFIRDAVHWRVVVVGDHAVAAYTNDMMPRDFRTTPSARAVDYTSSVPSRLASMAVDATRALGIEFGGVDILCEEAGQAQWVLEVNFPCYFPQAQLAGGIDVAGAIVQALADKSGRTMGNARP